MLTINSINKGIVIDHIKAGLGEKIFSHLKLNKSKTPVALIMNVSSNAVGRKDIIKIDEHIDLDYDFLGFVDPNITINIIEDGVITDKISLELPEKIENIIKCNNPRCITSIESNIPNKFYLASGNKGIYRCEYCDGEYSPF
ncbi:aspartate carbamoyltransferase regulatory subunit [Oceanirhabdus sp. W0125-5]|uniref:aspartate carbamoyltransferase regulatory subunit n=1 Tax=Oceanirhabdus sp. W0125-5 TaxID=2999116 RepID=UPI0022F307C3|nr:aspartate carbamoyltransferase regulatory subunit [Oceanirhabdus sp. W0125-5]WBW98905.1 aspartate carbamoyltransferase regulatory subunit [Oceanirhabdus sp. W0125-5]